MELYPNSTFAPGLIGGLGACSGGILLIYFVGFAFSIPDYVTELQSPSL